MRPTNSLNYFSFSLFFQDEKRRFQMELMNRETNFNKMFNANPQVGLLNPLGAKTRLVRAKCSPFFLSLNTPVYLVEHGRDLVWGFCSITRTGSFPTCGSYVVNSSYLLRAFAPSAHLRERRHPTCPVVIYIS